ncbi:hypothetical protein U9M48_032513 [Paspalum notatum var. saurae]|uniref:Uncharacterized protein n=1 Tax=Paspalum notatum var. saurae TaxID=547442 RepID=A0AAQ3U9G5_PASNO
MEERRRRRSSREDDDGRTAGDEIDPEAGLITHLVSLRTTPRSPTAPRHKSSRIKTMGSSP